MLNFSSNLDSVHFKAKQIFPPRFPDLTSPPYSEILDTLMAMVTYTLTSASSLVATAQNCDSLQRIVSA